MNTPPLVAIVIPCYNQAQFLRDAIDSALAQTYPRVEIIVVDDGSQDGTSGVALSYGSRLRLIHQDNAGLAAARNTAILAAEGEFICLLDSDDTLHPRCIETRLKPFLDDVEIGVVAGACRFVDENLNPLPEHLQLCGEPNPKRRGIYIRESWSPTPGLMVRKRAFELCGMFDTLLLGCEDFDFQMRATRRFKHVYLREPLADYRNPPQSLSRNYARHFEGLVQALSKNRAYAGNRAAYWWHSQVALPINTGDGVFGRIRKECGLRAAWSVALQLARKRPVAIALFFGWLVRAAWFRLLRAAGIARGGATAVEASS